MSGKIISPRSKNTQATQKLVLLALLVLWLQQNGHCGFKSFFIFRIVLGDKK
jgi:hypothetical protein